MALILRLDIVGQPIAWIPWQSAACLYARERVAWTAGEQNFTFYGGISRLSGLRSQMTVNSIVAVHGHTSHHDRKNHSPPPLTNRELFFRDAYMCMYCGKETHIRYLTRDHIQPLSRGGKDIWPNVVSACRSCNTGKGNRTPEEAKMPLLAVPYIPNWAEYLALCNRKILADQMQFLRKKFGKVSRLQHLH